MIPTAFRALTLAGIFLVSFAGGMLDIVAFFFGAAATTALILLLIFWSDK